MPNLTRVSNELKNTSYELFIGALSILSIVNLIFYIVIPTTESAILNVVKIMDTVFSIIFISDFTFRLFTADSKRHYFIHEYGWADLLASLPFIQFKILRLFRIYRIIKLDRKYGTKKLLQLFLANRGGSALITVFFFIILIFEFAGMGILLVERNAPNANIKTASDALWWISETVTTVGYGDQYPVTNPGRIIGILVMATGIGLVGTLTGFLAHAFLEPRGK